MGWTDARLIEDAVECNHGAVGDLTRRKYKDHLHHFAEYLAGVHQSNFHEASKKQVRLFMGHLEKAGGENPDLARLACPWCKARGYPDGRNGPGWSASTRKSYLSALRYLYRHFQADEDLEDRDPTILETSPKIIIKRGYTPSREDVKKLLATDGPPRARLLVPWMFFAPARRKTYSEVRWPDIDFEAAEWEVQDKNGKVYIYPLAPPLLRAFRTYRRWQFAEAERNPALRDALSDPTTAYVLLTANGKRTMPTTITKIATWHGIRAEVGLKKATPGADSVDGMTSLVTPHCFRRAWATLALNDEEDPKPIDVVSEVLMHKEIATTRRHYAPTLPERAQAAVADMRL